MTNSMKLVLQAIWAACHVLEYKLEVSVCPSDDVISDATWSASVCRQRYPDNDDDLDTYSLGGVGADPESALENLADKLHMILEGRAFEANEALRRFEAEADWDNLCLTFRKAGES